MEESKRQAQISREIQRIVGQIFLQTEFPGNCLVTIIRVTVAGDLSHATVFLSVIPDHAWNGVKNVLKRIGPEIQTVLSSELTAYKAPKLSFRLDEREQKARHLEALLDEVAKND